MLEWIKPVVVAGLRANNTVEEETEWMAALSAMLPLLNMPALKELMALSLSKGGVEEPVRSRIKCCKIMGAIAPYMSQHDVQNSLFKKALSMCQDTDYQVRICMCQELNSLARVLDTELTTGRLLPELSELLGDDEVLVRVAAMECLLGSLEFLPLQAHTEVVLPVLIRHMQPLEMDLEMQRCIAKSFGPLIVKVYPILGEIDSSQFLGCYRYLATRNDALVRQFCARNFPAVMKTLGPAEYSAHCHDTFIQLVADIDEEVRRIIASQFHEVAKMLPGDDCLKFLVRPLESLLQDASPVVRAKVLGTLPKILNRMCTEDLKTKQKKMSDMVPVLVQLGETAEWNWRIEHSMSLAFPHFVDHFTSDSIYSHFLPMAFNWLANGVHAVKEAAAEAVAAFLRHNKSEKQRTQTFVRIVKEFRRGKSYWSRMAFVDVCYHILRRFSTKFFKVGMAGVAQLMYDEIPNVRLHACRLMPSLKQTIRLPGDVNHLERLNSAMSNLMTDCDKDVSSAARVIHASFKRMPVRMAGGAGVLDMNGSAVSQSEFEEEDRRKEEEEQEITFDQEELQQ
eukprot:evm.model.scf_231.9 EVM.evm.TU.scf_231.9   scf_231:97841-105363(+)